MVEDEELVREILAECLTQLGYRVLAVGKPSEALSLLVNDTSIQVLISDFTLPEMNGVALAREVLARKPNLAIIIATGHHLDSSDLPDPAIQTLVKPFRPQALQLAIEAALNRHEGLSSLQE